MKHVKSWNISWLCAGLLLLNLTRLPAQVSTWTGASGGEWNTAASWSPGVPGPGTNALINGGSTVNYNLPMLAAGLGTLTNNGILNVNNNGFNAAGIIMLNPGGSSSNGRLLLNAGAAVTVTGNLGYCSNSIVSLAAGAALTIGGTLIIGSDVTGGNAGTGTVGSYGCFTNLGGTLTTAAVNLNPRNQSIGASCVFLIKGGTNILGAFSAQRSPGSANAPPATGSDGFMVAGGYVNTTSITIGNNDDGILYQSGGTITNTGTFKLANTTAQRPARFLQTAGLFVNPDPNVVLLNPSGGGDVTYTVQGGTSIVGGFQLGSGTATGTNYFTNAAAIYVGGQGIVSNGATVLISSLNNGGSFWATTNWSSTVAMRLAGGAFAFSPADAGGNGHKITWAGILSGAGGLLVTNAGTVVLAATNTYTGNTTIGSGGTLQLGDGVNNNGVVAGNLTNNGTLTMANPGAQTITSGLLGTGGLVESGPGTLILGTNTYTGGTTISAGTLQLGNGTTFDGAVPGNITNNATLVIANPTAQTLGNVISGGGTLVKSGAGTLTLSGNQTYTGSTMVNAGTLVVASTGSLVSTQNVTIAPGGLLDVSATMAGGYTLGNGYLCTAGHTTGSGPDFNGNLTCYGTLVVPTAATFALNGSLALMSGGTNVFNPGAAAGGNSLLTLNGGGVTLGANSTIQINFSVLGVGTYTLISGAGSVSGSLANVNLILNGPLGQDQASLQLTPTGLDLVVTGNPHYVVWQGDGSANSWDNNAANLDWSNAVTGAADYFVAGYYATFDNTGAANPPVLNAPVSPAWTTINGNSNYTFSGSGYINSGSLTNNSTGTVYVKTPNTYSGGTVINAGTVEVDAGGAIGTGPVLDNGALTYNGVNGSNPSLISGSGSVTVANGTQTWPAANSYAGGTTITAATLHLGTANAVPGGTVAGDVTANGTLDLAGFNDTINGLSGGGTIDTLAGPATLTVGANGDSGSFGGIMQNTGGTLNLVKTGGGVEVLGGANTYSGTTTIANGTLRLGANNAIPAGTTVTLGGNGTTGILDLGGYNEQLAGLAAGSGAVGTGQIIGNSSTTAAATLTITNGGTQTFGGTIQDVLGAGTKTVALVLNGGSLILTGSNTYSGGTTINSGGNTMLTVSGGLLAGSTLTMNSVNGSQGFLLSGGTAAFSGNVNFSADNGNNANYMNLAGGTFDAGSLTSGRTSLAFTTQPATGQATSLGIYVNGATVNITNTLVIGGGTAGGGNSSASMRLDAGSINVGGTTTITLNNGGRWSILDINGGTFTSVDKTGAGLKIGGVYAGASAEWLVRAGVASVNTITLGDSVQTSGTDLLDVTGGTLYLGAGGLVSGSASPAYTESVQLGSATLGAAANWSTTLPLTLASAMTFRAADANNNPFNITLNGPVSGSAGLTKTGGGTLTLGGTNTYTGLTTVSGGTLLVNGSLAGAVTLASGTTLGGTGSIAGTVTWQPGALASFTLGSPLTAGVLAANNNAVTVNVPGATPLAPGSYTLMNYTAAGSTGFFNTGTPAYTGAGAAPGTVSSLFTGGGAVILTVTSTSGVQLAWAGDGATNAWDYISTNWLEGGNLSVYNDGEVVLFSDSGSTTPPVWLTAALQPQGVLVNAAANYTFAGPGFIAGTATLTKTNSGTLTLLTTNNYSGSTTINEGVLQLGNGTVAGSVGTNLIQDAGTLVLDLPGSNNFANIISGTGGLVQAGAGTLVLTANNSYLGATTISAGTLQIDPGGALGTGSVTNNGALVFNTTGTSTIGSVISGSGSLTVRNTGTVSLNTNSTYSGGTTVSSGVLIVNNATGSATGSGAVTVASGATLGGAGTISGPVTINSGGILSPGNPVGTLKVNSNFTAASGAILNYTLGSASDLTAVSGNLSLSGTLNITNGPNYGDGTYTLFTYGGALTLGSLNLTMPQHSTGVINTSTRGQVNLVVTTLGAFPGAYGFGAHATGGRAGTVYHVTNLNDSGAGSFRDAVGQGNRIIIFDVGGTITLASAVTCSSSLTIAGQTAPGGIAIIGHEVSFSVRTNEIVRYLRIRPGSIASSTEDGINMGDGTNMIYDHDSIEFAPYNTIDAHGNYTGGNDITIQNSILADPIGQQFNAHTEASNNSFSWIGNILSSGHDRNPMAKVNNIFINNVVYNFQAGYTCADTSGNFSHDIINNYFITGPATTNPNDDFFQFDANQSVYAVGNLLDSADNGTLGGSTTAPGGVVTLNAPWSPVTATIPILSTASAYRADVSLAGALPADQVDALVLVDVTSLGTTGKGPGLWTTQASTGLGNNGYGVLTPGVPPVDTDGDGMPDYWKSAVGLSLTNGNDAMTIASDGYANIEHYLNWLAVPHAVAPGNSNVLVDLRQYSTGFTNASPVYAVSAPLNGTVVLQADGHTALFTPVVNYFGLGGFTFSVRANDGSTLTNTISVLTTVAPLIPPTIGGIQLAGGGGGAGGTVQISGSMGVPNGSYYLLGSTNLTLPLNQWTIFSTNGFDASGNFNCTAPAPAGSTQLFYLLQLP
jgi:autotransporter-associated beta strand protein